MVWMPSICKLFDQLTNQRTKQTNNIVAATAQWNCTLCYSQHSTHSHTQDSYRYKCKIKSENKILKIIINKIDVFELIKNHTGQRKLNKMMKRCLLYVHYSLWVVMVSFSSCVRARALCNHYYYYWEKYENNNRGSR